MDNEPPSSCIYFFKANEMGNKEFTTNLQNYNNCCSNETKINGCQDIEIAQSK